MMLAFVAVIKICYRNEVHGKQMLQFWNTFKEFQKSIKSLPSNQKFILSMPF